MNQFLHLSAQILFIALSAIAIADYVRQRNPRRRDFALLACSLGIPLGITLLKDAFGIRLGLLDLFGALVLFAQPYFLFRLLQYYRPSPRWMHWAILAGMVSCWVILFLFIARYPAATQAVIFGYCVIVDAYCTWAFSRGIQGSTGILRRRLTLIAASSGLFTLAVAGNVASALLPGLASTISAAGLAVTSISAVLFYLAFVPPRWLRNAWLFEELRGFLAPAPAVERSGPDTVSADVNCFAQLCSAATQSMNGMMAAVVQRAPAADEFIIAESTGSAFLPQFPPDGRQMVDDVWQQQKSAALYVPDVRDADQRRRLQAVGARTWLLVPIMPLMAPLVTVEHIWGVLVVLLRDRSLFIDDDLNLLELLAQQCATMLENRRMVEELQDYSAQLERRVEERTAALRELNTTLEERVEERTAELRRSNEELDRFAYAASHDLKAPLRAVQHLAHWIEQDAGEVLPGEAREHLAKLQGRVRRMEALLDDLLAYSRVGREHHTPEPIDMAELVHSVVEILAPPPGFTVRVTGELPVMRAERPPLEAVFRNLIGNAVKHHHRPGEGVVEICACEQEGYVEFSVADDGPGIAPEYHQRIFEIFQTLQPRDRVESSGIGLAIVKKSVERHGGTIQVDSAPGRGATFRFTWPMLSAIL